MCVYCWPRIFSDTVSTVPEHLTGRDRDLEYGPTIELGKRVGQMH